MTAIGPVRRVRVVPVMGTVFSLDLRPPFPSDAAVRQVIRWWHRVDRVFSPFRPGSLVSRLNHGSIQPAQCGADVIEVLGLCDQARAATGGYFDAWATGQFDPCGLVKGWSVEAASAMLTAAGSLSHCINGGGDTRCRGQAEPGRDWHVGIADPLRPGAIAAAVAVADGAVATSGTAERGQHILNPRTGKPATELASVTVIGADLTWADAYATAAFAMGGDALDWLCRLDGHEGLVIGAEGTTRQTPGLAALLGGLAR